VVALLALTACGDDGDASAGPGAGERLRVVATTMQLQDFVRQVGGDRVEVRGLLDAGAEPHEYEPTPDAADAVSGADVVVRNGGDLDDWLEDLLRLSDGEGTLVTALDGVPLEGDDPHAWHDPERAKAMVREVAAGLAAADPAGRDAYVRGAARYAERLDLMAREIRATFAGVPRERRKLVTTHDAFGYFARAYGIDVVGSVLASATTETEPSARQVRALVDTIRREGVRTIFTEEALDPRLERQIAREAGATVSASLYADVLAESGPAATHVGAQLANARAMAAAWR
jgi:ABC-type Zn uptake system ZnuABC Zn-binding protein ZnuA